MEDVLGAEMLSDAQEFFDQIDKDGTGFITDKDHVYGLFLALGITFESEDEFNEVLKAIEDHEQVASGEAGLEADSGAEARQEQ